MDVMIYFAAVVYAPVAQLDSAAPSYGAGQRFESSSGHHYYYPFKQNWSKKQQIS